jgi:hypothetical protein
LFYRHDACVVHPPKEAAYEALKPENITAHEDNSRGKQRGMPNTHAPWRMDMPAPMMNMAWDCASKYVSC